MNRQFEEKPSFLKKRSKRLLFAVAGLSGSVRQRRKSFLVLFFKKEHSFANVSILATCILASSLAFVDGSVVNVALPAIGADFAARSAALQWVVNGYLLPLAALLLLGGAAGDRWGRRPLLLMGITTFAVASFGCAFAPSLDF